MVLNSPLPFTGEGGENLKDFRRERGCKKLMESNRLCPLSDFRKDVALLKSVSLPQAGERHIQGEYMLKGIHPALSPELLKVLAEMGHGDEIVLSDAHFPAHQLHHKVIRADGIQIATLLEAITPLFEYDQYVERPLAMMQAVPGDSLDPTVEERYLAAIAKINGKAPLVERVERFAFYDRAKTAYAVVITGELAKYGNIILKKGVTPV